MTDAERKRREEEMKLLLLLLLLAYEPLIGTVPDALLVSRFQAEAASKLAPLLAGTFEGGASAVGAQAGRTAALWATEYSEALAADIAATTRDRLAAARQAQLEGLDDEADEILGNAFGEDRAESIAITETTRADTMGQMHGAREAEKEGAELTAIWVAENDGRVCSICQRMDGQPEENWEYLVPELAAGPPAHPRCRCSVKWVRGDDDQEQPAEAAPRGPREPSEPTSPVILQDRPERQQLDLQGKPVATAESGQPLDIEFTKPGAVNPRHGVRKLVTVDVAKLDAAWQRSQPGLYIDDQGKGPAAIDGRFEQANRFLDQAARDGIKVEASVVDVDDAGKVFVSDGRHRLAALRARGFTEIQIAVPPRQAQQFRDLYGVDET